MDMYTHASICQPETAHYLHHILRRQIPYSGPTRFISKQLKVLEMKNTPREGQKGFQQSNKVCAFRIHFILSDNTLKFLFLLTH